MIILDANAYRINAGPIKAWRQGRLDEPVLEAITLIAVAYSIPIIVVTHYVCELEGYSDKLIEFIQRLMTFYTVSEVLGVDKIILHPDSQPDSL